MTHHPVAIPRIHHHKPNPLALGMVILLHLGLILAIGNAIGVKSSLPVLRELRVSVIEAPQLPTKPLPTQPRNPDLSPPLPLPDIAPTLPAVEGPHHGITRTKPAAEAKPVAPLPAKAIVPPAIDPRRPLTQPAYPPSSRRAGEQGTVELMLYVLADGRIGEAKVARSSGFHRLDDAAIKEALRAWRLRPQREGGTAVPAWHKIAVTFRLER